jgi:ATP-dependent Lhr-like helicase
MTGDPFSRLAPFIREFIYEKKWTGLRNIQEAAISAIFGSEEHILIAAGTASGKTEAAFFPVLSSLWEHRPASIGALYISPLKALINDQGERLRPLAEEAGIPLWRWHGDVPGSHKQKLLDKPSGILQITPESLEALLLRHPEKLPRLFSELAFVIIDEVHAFMGTERGGQILCQLARIEQACGRKVPAGGRRKHQNPRRIGLSATLGDYRQAMDWLSLGSPGRGGANILIKDEKLKRRINIALEYYSRSRGGEKDYYESLYRQCRGLRCIIFTNSRLDAEETIAGLRTLSLKTRGDDRYRIHHGSVSPALRGEAEKELRESHHPVTMAATSTLELGIDIGNLDRVIQIGPPSSVSAFVQRLGRSGRRTGVSEIYFTYLDETPAPRPEAALSPAGADPSTAFSALPWVMLKTIAVIELYLKEKWIEDAPGQPLPYNLLLHQTLSILASLGEHSGEDLAARVLSLPCFSGIDTEDFSQLLSCLNAASLTEKTENGNYILGLEGEKIVNHYSFYSIFAGGSDYRVLRGHRELGRINFIPPIGGGIILGGQSWQVERVDPKHREIHVYPGDAGSTRVWRGGGADIHPRVIKKVKEILLNDETYYPYLFPSAGEHLEESRRLAGETGLTKSSWIDWAAGEDEKTENGAAEDGGKARIRINRFSLFPWLGSRGMRTLLLILQYGGFKKALSLRSVSRDNDYSLTVESALPVPLFKMELKSIINSLDDASSLIDPQTVPPSGKFDALLPRQLLVKQYAANMLDLGEIKKWAETIA